MKYPPDPEKQKEALPFCPQATACCDHTQALCQRRNHYHNCTSKKKKKKMKGRIWSRKVACSLAPYSVACYLLHFLKPQGEEDEQKHM